MLCPPDAHESRRHPDTSGGRPCSPLSCGLSPANTLSPKQPPVSAPSACSVSGNGGDQIYPSQQSESQGRYQTPLVSQGHQRRWVGRRQVPGKPCGIPEPPPRSLHRPSTFQFVKASGGRLALVSVAHSCPPLSCFNKCLGTLRNGSKYLNLPQTRFKITHFITAPARLSPLSCLVSLDATPHPSPTGTARLLCRDAGFLPWGPKPSTRQQSSHTII